ncbi:MAG TPA: phosphate ABC transporter permease PstA [Opitutales bacterium]|nr:phosphate ABC transporter permease PstA [Opitutales bacterium]
METKADKGTFRHNPKSWAHRRERIVLAALRAMTYFVIFCAAFLFLDIIIKGAPTVFRTQFPFVNVEFLTASPETLHVFEYQGRHMELPDVEFRDWVAANGIDVTTFKDATYAYSGGGILPAILGTILLVAGSMVIALFLGILSAIYLSEYASDSKFIRLIRLSIVNLAGVPSIVFGLFGMGMFVFFFGWGVSLIAGWFTLAFMVLPIIITASEQSLKAVPKGFREGALALGATKWQTIRTNVLPYALPGILTSSILSIARVAGETAPIMFTTAFAMRDKMPWQVDSVWGFFKQGVMALPYHIYVVSSKIPQNEYTARMQYGTALVFMILVTSIATLSIYFRQKARQKYRW